MTKAIELADQIGAGVPFDEGEIERELRRLAAVEQELADLKAAIGEPVAYENQNGIVRGIGYQWDALSRLRPLYAIKAAK